MPSGGPRTPNNPAVASGPGRLSQRVDGGPASKQAARWVAGGDYGDGGLMDIQHGAPMAQSQGAAPASAMSGPLPANPQGGQQEAGPQPIPLTVPSQRPNEPVTNGANAGPGAGTEALRLPPQANQGGTTARQIVQTLASHPDASPILKQLADTLGR